MKKFNVYLESYSKMEIPVKAAIWFTLSSFMLRGISFITVPIFTRILSTTEFGVLNVYSAWTGIIQIIVTLNLTGGVYQRGLVEFPNDNKNFKSSLQTLSSLISLLWLAILIIFNEPISHMTGIPYSILLVFMISLIFYPAYEFWMYEKRMHFDYKKVVSITMLYTLAVTCFSIIVVSIESTAYAKIVTSISVGMIFYLILYIKNHKIGFVLKNFSKAKFYWKYALKFNIPLVPHYLSLIILNEADRIMINNLVGTSQAGIYGVAYALGYAIIIFQTSINQVFTPWHYQKMKEKHYEDIGNSATLLLIVLAVIVFSFINIAPELVKFLYIEEYYDAVWTIPPVSLSVFFIFVYTLFGNVEFYFKRTKFIMIASSLGAVLNIILNYFGIKLFGYIACGYTTLICYIFFAIIHYIFMKRVCIQNIEDAIIFNFKKIILISVILITASLCVVLLYGYPIVRYSILFLIMCFSFIKRNKIPHIFSITKGGKLS